MEYPRFYFWLHEEFRRRMKKALYTQVEHGNLTLEENEALKSILDTRHMADVMRLTDLKPLFVQDMIRDVAADTLGWLTMTPLGAAKVNPRTGYFICEECSSR